jgi:uncharacterized protein YecT (DUF1311 family)
MVLIVLAATAAALSATPERRYSAEFEACSRKTGGVTVAIRDCIGDEYQRLDTDLNRRYRLLMRTLPKARANALRISERRWIVERKRKCDVAGKENDGGTLELIMIDSCYLDSLYDRVVVLEAMQR